MAYFMADNQVRYSTSTIQTRKAVVGKNRRQMYVVVPL